MPNMNYGQLYGGQPSIAQILQGMIGGGGGGGGGRGFRYGDPSSILAPSSVTAAATAPPPTTAPSAVPQFSGGARRGGQGRGGLRSFLNKQGPTLSSGYGTLADIINSQGRTDPMAFNRELAGIDRGVQTIQDYYRGLGANEGFGQGGIFGALQGAAGIGGVDLASQAQARENATAEQRKRDDQQLLLSMILGPKFQARQMNIDEILGLGALRNQNRAQALNERNSLRSTIGNMINSIIGGIGGGIG